ncbi:OLC1v1032980C1 [Oldenlandia corymbosa var. corymbosa]|uniref:UDP-3-O-acyl-N-acetylglucosamine deacetylase n=1 Tax=Oldenlandia corymbosa var. corymbosa TaxID=529605 RepID=A0AAV1CQB0_OLDCO|nr:OLC1v1032980C1 [Oldenlandia corymbosa var. corymbosa]
MTLAGFCKTAVKSSAVISWKPTGKLQQTVANCIERTGVGLHSGKLSTVRIWPELAGEGRYFDFNSKIICATIDNVKETPLCTTLCKEGYSVRTVEHLLSALEGIGVDNCRIEIQSCDPDDASVEVPLFDGSAKEWVDGIQEVGLKAAVDHDGKSLEKLAPFLNEPVCVSKNDSHIIAFPYPKTKIRYGIHFPKVPAIGHQWFYSGFGNENGYAKEIAPSRTFCIYEQVEKLRDAGLIGGGSAENAIVCSETRGWLNPPLRFDNEPCRHKVLDFIGDVSLLARAGSQGIPVADIIAYKASPQFSMVRVGRIFQCGFLLVFLRLATQVQPCASTKEATAEGELLASRQAFGKYNWQILFSE